MGKKIDENEDEPWTEEWLGEELNLRDSEDSDICIESGEGDLQVWHNFVVRIELPADHCETKGQARRIVEFLRSFTEW